MTLESELNNRARRVTSAFRGWTPEDKEPKARFEIGDELFHLAPLRRRPDHGAALDRAKDAVEIPGQPNNQ